MGFAIEYATKVKDVRMFTVFGMWYTLSLCVFLNLCGPLLISLKHSQLVPSSFWLAEDTNTQRHTWKHNRQVNWRDVSCLHVMALSVYHHLACRCWTNMQMSHDVGQLSFSLMADDTCLSVTKIRLVSQLTCLTWLLLTPAFSHCFTVSFMIRQQTWARAALGCMTRGGAFFYWTLSLAVQ